MNKALDLKPLAPLVAAVRQGQLLTLLPQALEGLFPGLGFVLFAFCPGQAPRCLVDNLSPSKGHQAIGPYLAGMYQLDPLYNYAQECPADALVSLKQIMPIGFRQSDYYRQYYRNLQLDGEMALCIRRDDALLVLSIGFYGRRVPRSLRDDLALLQPLIYLFLSSKSSAFIGVVLSFSSCISSLYMLIRFSALCFQALRSAPSVLNS